MVCKIVAFGKRLGYVFGILIAVSNSVFFVCTANNREETGFRPIRDVQRYQPVDISEHLQQLDGDIREFTMQLQNEK